jgi:hypothetical protein
MNTTPKTTQVTSIPVEPKSEYALLMERIDQEVESGKRAIYGIAQGTARHKVINHRMDEIGKYSEKLQALIGDKAYPVILEKIGQLSDIPRSV